MADDMIYNKEKIKKIYIYSFFACVMKVIAIAYIFKPGNWIMDDY